LLIPSQQAIQVLQFGSPGNHWRIPLISDACNNCAPFFIGGCRAYARDKLLHKRSISGVIFWTERPTPTLVHEAEKKLPGLIFPNFQNRPLVRAPRS
jgi:hypothetical protein